MKREETYNVEYIPNNIDVGINILGFNLKARFLAEGIILGVILSAITYFMIQETAVQVGTKIGTAIAVGVIGLFVGIRGLNDEPVTEFIYHAIKFSSKQRTAFYNPRVRHEAKPYIQEIQNSKREKLMNIYSQYKEKTEKSNQEKSYSYQNDNIFDSSNMYFEDDIGVIDKPVEYMSSKEKKIFKKHLKRKEKS